MNTYEIITHCGTYLLLAYSYYHAERLANDEYAGLVLEITRVPSI